MRIAEHRDAPAVAKEIKIMCPHCSESMFVKRPPTWVERQKLMSEAINEHRKLCAKAPPEAQRVYEITYPRV